MKTIKSLIALSLLAVGAAQAATVDITGFGGFTPTVILQPQPINPADGPWTDLTTESGTTAFTVANFGNGAPSGLVGNGFINYLSATEDWSGFSFLQLSGFALAGNATPSLYFYLEDINSNVSSLTQIDLTGFGGTLSTGSFALDFGAIDATQVLGWGFVANEATATAFGFTFDHLALSTTASTPAVPDGASSALLLGGALFGLAGLRRAIRAA